MCDTNVTVHRRGEEHYVFLWRDDALPELFRVIGRYASDERLSFNWFDAAQLSMALRRSQSRPANSGASSDCSSRLGGVSGE